MIHVACHFCLSCVPLLVKSPQFIWLFTHCVLTCYVTMITCEIVDGMVNMMEHSMWEECISRKLIPEVISSVAQSLDLLYDVLLWIMWGC